MKNNIMMILNRKSKLKRNLLKKWSMNKYMIKITLKLMKKVR